jgi:hypothetical protein
MSAKKISEQDMKMGRIHRCGNCDTKCDETYKGETYKLSWGQKTQAKSYYFCCVDCEKYFVREKLRPDLESSLAHYNEVIPKLMELLSHTIKFGKKIPCLFETIRYLKHLTRASEMLLSQEHTYAEVQVAYLKARDVALELSEDLQDEKNKLHKKYFNIEYRIVINDAKVCDELMNDGISAWF